MGNGFCGQRCSGHMRWPRQSCRRPRPRSRLHFWIRNPPRGYSPVPWRRSPTLLGALQLACHILCHPWLSLDTGLLGQDHDGSTHGALRTRWNKGSNLLHVYLKSTATLTPQTEGSWGQHTPAPLWGHPKQPLQPVMVNSMCQLDQAPGCPRVLSDIGCLWGAFWLSRLGKMDLLPQCGWAPSSPSRAWTEQKDAGRENSLSLSLLPPDFELGHGFLLPLDWVYTISTPGSESFCTVGAPLSGLQTYNLFSWASSFIMGLSLPNCVIQLLIINLSALILWRTLTNTEPEKHNTARKRTWKRCTQEGIP